MNSTNNYLFIKYGVIGYLCVKLLFFTSMYLFAPTLFTPVLKLFHISCSSIIFICLLCHIDPLCSFIRRFLFINKVACISCFLVFSFLINGFIHFFTSAINVDFYWEFTLMTVLSVISIVKIVSFVFKITPIIKVSIVLILSVIMGTNNYRTKTTIQLSSEKYEYTLSILKYPFNKKCYIAPYLYTSCLRPKNDYLLIDDRSLNIYLNDSIIQIFAYPDYIKGRQDLMKGINKLKDTLHFKYYEYSDDSNNEYNLIIKSKESKTKTNCKDYTWFDVSVNYPVLYNTRKKIFKKCNGLF